MLGVMQQTTTHCGIPKVAVLPVCKRVHMQDMAKHVLDGLISLLVNTCVTGCMSYTTEWKYLCVQLAA